MTGVVVHTAPATSKTVETKNEETINTKTENYEVFKFQLVSKWKSSISFQQGGLGFFSSTFTAYY